MKRKQIAAANWKMNCTLDEAKQLLSDLASGGPDVNEHQQVIIGVPFPYLPMAAEMLRDKKGYVVSAQDCYSKNRGAYTGEVSASMIASCGVTHVIIGHSERREYFGETSEMLAEKVHLALENNLKPIFCCGETLYVRESGKQNEYVGKQLSESLFDLSAEQIAQIIIAYEPVWAIGTGKTATSEQAQEMHAYIRETLAGKYGEEAAGQISILYGGSVKGENAADIFQKPDVDGGLVGGASLKYEEFKTIIGSLKTLS